MADASLTCKGDSDSSDSKNDQCTDTSTGSAGPAPYDSELIDDHILLAKTVQALFGDVGDSDGDSPGSWRDDSGLTRSSDQPGFFKQSSAEFQNELDQLLVDRVSS